MLGSRAVGLPLLRTVDAAEADTFRALVMEDFDRLAVENGDNGAGEVGSTDNSWDEQGFQQQDWGPVRDHGRYRAVRNCHHVGCR